MTDGFLLEPRLFPTPAAVLHLELKSCTSLSLRDEVSHALIDIYDSSMASAVRQPIDVASLSSYIAKQVPDIQLPISVKQVLPDALATNGDLLTPDIVWLWTIKSYLPAYGGRRKEICATKETSWQASLKDRAPN